MVLAIDGVDQRLKTSLEYFFEDAHDSGPRSRPLIGWCGSSSRAWVRGGGDFSLRDEKDEAISSYTLDSRNSHGAQPS
jgi:hypothetical protein